MSAYSLRLPVFQSTPLLRGATSQRCINLLKVRFQSTPLLRGATEDNTEVVLDEQFQSTPLLRGATVRLRQAVLVDSVSIHAPLARGDGDCKISA